VEGVVAMVISLEVLETGPQEGYAMWLVAGTIEAPEHTPLQMLTRMRMGSQAIRIVMIWWLLAQMLAQIQSLMVS
jgi:hypothetical protein